MNTQGVLYCGLLHVRIYHDKKLFSLNAALAGVESFEGGGESLLYPYSAMKLGLNKCAVKRYERVEPEGIEILSDEMMKGVDEDGHKFPWMLEAARVLQKKVKEKIGNQYLRCLNLLAKPRLYSENLVRGINVWAVIIVHYSAGILGWSEAELYHLDTKIEKVLMMNGAFHRNSSVSWLSLKGKMEYVV